jgi:nucleoside-diphosphate-sugar epimerase
VKCLVSGATGFVGRHLCQQLAARGDTVIALSRSGASLPGGIPTRALDLTRGDVGDSLVQGVDVVFHLAGIAHQYAMAADYDQLNVDASLRLARQAAASGVRCFVFLSSVKAMGPAPGSDPRSEQDCTPPASPYGLSKWRAECALREEFVGGDMAVVILRPALIYGAQPRGNLRLLANGVRRGLPRPPGGGARSMVALPDLVDLLCLLSVEPPAGIRTWIVTGDRDYSTLEVYDLMRRAVGKGRGSAWLPRWGWRLGAWLLDRARREAGESTWDKLFGTERYDNSALVTATGWRPSYTLQDLVGSMVAAPGGAG